MVPPPFLGFGGELVALVGLVGIVHAELHADDVALLESRFVTIRLPDMRDCACECVCGGACVRVRHTLVT